MYISRFAKSFLIIIFAIFILTMLAMLHAPSRAYVDQASGQLFGEGGVEKSWHPNTDQENSPSQSKPEFKDAVPIVGAEGGVIMPKLGNETAKAALGRATWKLLHTVTLRFPEDPTEDERHALDSYIRLTSRLYPCGECATEFQQLLKKFPPQTSSRRSASLWLCSVHNQVNKRLKKPDFDCANLDAEYDCGCGDAPLNLNSTTTTPPPPPTTKSSDSELVDLERDPTKDELTGADLIKGGR